MKKMLIISLFSALIVLLFACASSGSSAYKVEFAVDDGSPVEAVVTDRIGEAPVSTRENYILVGWYLDEEMNYKAEFPLAILGDTILYAKWESSFSITYRVDSAVYKIEYYVAGATVTKIPDPVMQGRRFNGWDSDIPAQMPAQHITIGGTFTAESYKICFETASDVSYSSGIVGLYPTTDNGEHVEYPYITVMYGYADYIEDLKEVEPTRTGYDFDGWSYYDAEKHERVDFEAIGAWAIASNVLLRPKWVQYGTQGLQFSKVPHDDRDVLMVSSYSGRFERVIIPAEHEGKKVVKIAAGAFSGATNITNLTIPDTITEIGENAFFGCVNIVDINLPDSVTAIGKGAFSGCESIITITLPKAITAIQALTFAGCLSLRKVEFPKSSGFIRIDDQAFQNCSLLFDFVLPESLKTIGKYAFENCSSINSLQGIVNSQIYEIGDFAFRGCTSLDRVTLPNTLRSIGQEAFKDCERIIQVGIQENLLSIGAGAFQNCKNLQRLSIPRTVTSLGSAIFLNCSTLIYVATPNQVNWPTGWADDWNLANSETGAIHELSELQV
ncbi:MAG: leucine-rich repeat protein [Christensenellaceae bacterium]|jgi:hypothetical protein|nr:leucine-rich repeat protein [Christensenellaceae bacterium]